MRKFKYPLLLLLVLSVVAAEGYGQYVRVQGAVEMNDGKDEIKIILPIY